MLQKEATLISNITYHNDAHSLSYNTDRIPRFRRHARATCSIVLPLTKRQRRQAIVAMDETNIRFNF